MIKKGWVYRGAALMAPVICGMAGSAGMVGAQAVPEAGKPTAPQGTMVTGASVTTAASSANDTTKRPWSGEAEAGLINTTGNSRSESLRARFKIAFAAGRWKHSMTGDLVRVSDRGATTTEQYTGTLRSDRTLTIRSYLFATARYDTDRMAGNSPRVAESAGYGRRFLFSNAVRLETEAGAGARHTWYTDGTRNSEGIIRVALKFVGKFGMMSEFSEEAFSEFGTENVHSESSTSLKTKVNTSFSMKVNMTLKHDTVVPAEHYKTDTITSVTLVYDL